MEDFFELKSRVINNFWGTLLLSLLFHKILIQSKDKKKIDIVKTRDIGLTEHLINYLINYEILLYCIKWIEAKSLHLAHLF